MKNLLRNFYFWWATYIVFIIVCMVYSTMGCNNAGKTYSATHGVYVYSIEYIQKVEQDVVDSCK